MGRSQYIRIVKLDPRTNKPIVSLHTKKEWYELQRDQWVESIITRLEIVLSECDRIKKTRDEIPKNILNLKNRLLVAFDCECTNALECIGGGTNAIRRSESDDNHRELRRLRLLESYFKERREELKHVISEETINKLKGNTHKYLKAILTKMKNSTSGITHIVETDPWHRKKEFHEKHHKDWSESETTKMDYFQWLDVHYSTTRINSTFAFTGDRITSLITEFAIKKCCQQSSTHLDSEALIKELQKNINQKHIRELFSEAVIDVHFFVDIAENVGIEVAQVHNLFSSFKEAQKERDILEEDVVVEEDEDDSFSQNYEDKLIGT